ncbi:hypothetical protein [Micromonospora schwarzwaldensis]
MEPGETPERAARREPAKPPAPAVKGPGP